MRADRHRSRFPVTARSVALAWAVAVALAGMAGSGLARAEEAQQGFDVREIGRPAPGSPQGGDFHQTLIIPFTVNDLTGRIDQVMENLSSLQAFKGQSGYPHRVVFSIGAITGSAEQQAADRAALDGAIARIRHEVPGFADKRNFDVTEFKPDREMTSGRASKGEQLDQAVATANERAPADHDTWFVFLDGNVEFADTAREYLTAVKNAHDQGADVVGAAYQRHESDPFGKTYKIGGDLTEGGVKPLWNVFHKQLEKQLNRRELTPETRGLANRLLERVERLQQRRYHLAGEFAVSRRLLDQGWLSFYKAFRLESGVMGQLMSHADEVCIHDVMIDHPFRKQRVYDKGCTEEALHEKVETLRRAFSARNTDSETRALEDLFGGTWREMAADHKARFRRLARTMIQRLPRDFTPNRKVVELVQEGAGELAATPAGAFFKIMNKAAKMGNMSVESTEAFMATVVAPLWIDATPEGQSFLSGLLDDVTAALPGEIQKTQRKLHREETKMFDRETSRRVTLNPHARMNAAPQRAAIGATLRRNMVGALRGFAAGIKELGQKLRDQPREERANALARFQQGFGALPHAVLHEPRTGWQPRERGQPGERASVHPDRSPPPVRVPRHKALTVMPTRTALPPTHGGSTGPRHVAPRPSNHRRDH